MMINIKPILKLFLYFFWMTPFHCLWAYQKPDSSAIEWIKAQQLTWTSLNKTMCLDKADPFYIRKWLNEIQSLKNDRLLIFVSFSMPSQSLKQWLNQATEMGGTLVIRGLVNNSFKETILKVKELLNGNTGSLQIDPNLFKQYGIQQVPAVVLEEGNEFSVIYGDVPLMNALEWIAKRKLKISIAKI